jgi:hypothetical protein
MTSDVAPNDDYASWLSAAGDDERILYARSDRWITYPRAASILNRMEELLAHPRNSRMPSLLVIANAGMGKTQIDERFCRLYPPRFDEESNRSISPVVSVQMPAAATDRLFYMTLIRAIGGVFSPRISTAEAMCMALQLYSELGVRLLIFDEAHNMLAGSFRDQRRILTQLRYVSNELKLPLVCFGVFTAREAIASDAQLARRFGMMELPAWEVDVNFKGLISTALKGLPLRRPTSLEVVAMQTIIRSTRGNTARIFEMIGDLAVQAIKNGEERITAEMIVAWKPSMYERTLVA